VQGLTVDVFTHSDQLRAAVELESRRNVGCCAGHDAVDRRSLLPAPS
jgi:hypothetical protein